MDVSTVEEAFRFIEIRRPVFTDIKPSIFVESTVDKTGNGVSLSTCYRSSATVASKNAIREGVIIFIGYKRPAPYSDSTPQICGAEVSSKYTIVEAAVGFLGSYFFYGNTSPSLGSFVIGEDAIVHIQVCPSVPAEPAGYASSYVFFKQTVFDGQGDGVCSERRRIKN